MWDVGTGERLAETTLAELAPGSSSSASPAEPVFSPDGRYVDVATNLGVARFGATDLRPSCSPRPTASCRAPSVTSRARPT